MAARALLAKAAKKNTTFIQLKGYKISQLFKSPWKLKDHIYFQNVPLEVSQMELTAITLQPCSKINVLNYHFPDLYNLGTSCSLMMKKFISHVLDLLVHFIMVRDG